jgi:hypothetical protein
VIIINNQYILNNDYYNNTLLVQDAISRIFFAIEEKKETEPDFSFIQRIENKAQRVIQCTQNEKVADELFFELDAQTGTPKSINRFQLVCNSRLCPHCSRRNQRRNLFKIYKEIQEYQTPRFITVGFRAVHTLTKTYIKQISKLHYNFMKELRVKRKWHQKFDLGRFVSVMEIVRHYEGEPKYDSETKEIISYYKKDQWYIHFHTIFDGDYLPNKKENDYLITEIFKRITKGEGNYVYIKKITNKVRDRGKASNYISKYLSKGYEQYPLMKDRIEFFKATRKIRFVRFGGRKRPYRNFSKHFEWCFNEKKTKYVKFSSTRAEQGIDWEDYRYEEACIHVLFELGLEQIEIFDHTESILENLYQNWIEYTGGLHENMHQSRGMVCALFREEALLCEEIRIR